MSYNFASVLSIIITALISLLISYFGTLLFLEANHGFFKIVQLIVAIICMTTFYAPIKYLLFKYMDVSDLPKE